jgi:hypothetical protein
MSEIKLNLKSELDLLCGQYLLEVNLIYKNTKEIINMKENRNLEISNIFKNNPNFETIIKRIKNFRDDEDRKKFDSIKLDKKIPERIKKEIQNCDIREFWYLIFDIYLSQINMKAILKMSHIYLFTLFEAFNKDFFIKLLKNKPNILIRNKKQIECKEIVHVKSILELHEKLASKEIEQISYKNIDELAKYLHKLLKIDLKTDFENWDEIRENYYRRNIIVHNNGKISDIYIEKIKVDKSLINEELENDIDYIESCSTNIINYINFIKKIIFKKFSLS